MAYTNVDKGTLERLLKTNTYLQTAEKLGVSRATVDRAIKIYGIKRSYRDLIDGIEVSEKTMQILYGSSLGDGNIRFNPSKNLEANFRAEHCVKQKDYLFWKYENLKDICAGEPKLNSSKYPSWYFTTRCHKDITTLYSQFYDNEGAKRLPDNFEYYINPVSLMVWFLDDGTTTFKMSTRAELCVQGFTVLDIGRMIGTFKSKFGIDCKPSVRFDKRYGKHDTNIRFSKEGTLVLFSLIQPLVEVESMMYKVYPCNDYVPTSKKLG